MSVLAVVEQSMQLKSVGKQRNVMVALWRLSLHQMTARLCAHRPVRHDNLRCDHWHELLSTLSVSVGLVARKGNPTIWHGQYTRHRCSIKIRVVQENFHKTNCVKADPVSMCLWGQSSILM